MKHSRRLSELRWGILAPLALFISSPDLEGQFLTVGEARLAEAVAPPPSVRAGQFAAARVGAWNGPTGDEAGETILESHLAAQEGRGGADWAGVIIFGAAGAVGGLWRCGKEEQRQEEGACCMYDDTGREVGCDRTSDAIPLWFFIAESTGTYRAVLIAKTLESMQSNLTNGWS